MGMGWAKVMSVILVKIIDVHGAVYVHNDTTKYQLLPQFKTFDEWLSTRATLHKDNIDAIKKKAAKLNGDDDSSQLAKHAIEQIKNSIAATTKEVYTWGGLTFHSKPKFEKLERTEEFIANQLCSLILQTGKTDTVKMREYVEKYLGGAALKEMQKIIVEESSMGEKIGLLFGKAQTFIYDQPALTFAFLYFCVETVLMPKLIEDPLGTDQITIKKADEYRIKFLYILLRTVVAYCINLAMHLTPAKNAFAISQFISWALLSSAPPEIMYRVVGNDRIIGDKNKLGLIFQASALVNCWAFDGVLHNARLETKTLYTDTKHIDEEHKKAYHDAIISQGVRIQDKIMRTHGPAKHVSEIEKESIGGIYITHIATDIQKIESARSLNTANFKVIYAPDPINMDALPPTKRWNVFSSDSKYPIADETYKSLSNIDQMDTTNRTKIASALFDKRPVMFDIKIETTWLEPESWSADAGIVQITSQWELEEAVPILLTRNMDTKLRKHVLSIPSKCFKTSMKGMTNYLFNFTRLAQNVVKIYLLKHESIRKNVVDFLKKMSTNIKDTGTGTNKREQENIFDAIDNVVGEELTKDIEIGIKTQILKDLAELDNTMKNNDVKDSPNDTMYNHIIEQWDRSDEQKRELLKNVPNSIERSIHYVAENHDKTLYGLQTGHVKVFFQKCQEILGKPKLEEMIDSITNEAKKESIKTKIEWKSTVSSQSP